MIVKAIVTIVSITEACYKACWKMTRTKIDTLR